MKNILVQFDIKAGEYEHRDFYLFKKKQSEYKYCKEFWGLTKKRELSENVFWDNQIQNTIEVYSETELTDKQAKTLAYLVLPIYWAIIVIATFSL